MSRMKKLFSIVLLVTLFVSQANALELLCTDDFCIIPTATPQGEPVYGIVSPVGYHDVDMIEQAPGLIRWMARSSHWWAAVSWLPQPCLC